MINNWEYCNYCLHKMAALDCIVSVLLLCIFNHVTMISSKTVDNFVPLKYLSCNCERIYVPVCGTDGLTYTNECKLNCVNILRNASVPVRVNRWGPCIFGQRRKLNDVTIIPIHIGFVSRKNFTGHPLYQQNLVKTDSMIPMRFNISLA